MSASHATLVPVGAYASSAACPITAGVAPPAARGSAYARSYAPVDVLANPQALVATVAPNPKAPGSKAHERYGFYKVGVTVAAALASGIRRDDLRWDIRRGFVTLAEPTEQ